MNERELLLESLATKIKNYRNNEIHELTPEHVDRWLHQFTPNQQVPFLRELNYVLQQTYISEEWLKNFCSDLVVYAPLTGSNPTSYWANVNFLNIQQNGQSQTEILRLIEESLLEKFKLSISACGSSQGDYVYIDDVMFSGDRLRSDLTHWITHVAPPAANIVIVTAIRHTGGQYSAEKRISETILQSGKSINIRYLRRLEIESRKFRRNTSGVLWPATFPNTPEVQSYLSIPTRFPHVPRLPSIHPTPPFSSEIGRQILENEFLIAGAKIISQIDNPKSILRPLGYSSFGVGFGSLIVTYRNCPNNCPLALWWGDAGKSSKALNWYPLLPRKGYVSINQSANEFADFDF